MSEELLPCPFCGGSPYVITDNYKGVDLHKFCCSRCDATTNSWNTHRATAASCWNTRHNPAPQNAEIKALRKLARAYSIEIMRHSGGGSEMFKTVAGEPYADPELCGQRIDEIKESRLRLTRKSHNPAPQNAACPLCTGCGLVWDHGADAGPGLPCDCAAGDRFRPKSQNAERTMERHYREALVEIAYADADVTESPKIIAKRSLESTPLEVFVKESQNAEALEALDRFEEGPNWELFAGIPEVWKVVQLQRHIKTIRAALEAALSREDGGE